MTDSGSPTGEPTERHRTARWWLAVPFVGVYGVDVLLTLSGQPPDYWAGDRTSINEINPVGHVVLMFGPTAFAVATVAWLIVVVVAALFWRSRIVDWVVMAFTAGHGIGGACWLARHGGWWFAVACGYLTVAAAVADWCWRRKGRPT